MGFSIMRALYEAQEARENAPSPDAGRNVPPDPTRWPSQPWGEAYPCLQQSAVGQSTTQCAGKMIPAKRCFRYEDRLWRKFKCNRCGREATDWKDEDASPSPA